MMDLNHYTLNTGHCRRSPRSEVWAQTMDHCQSVAEHDRGDLGRYTVVLTWAQADGGCVYTFYRGEMPLVTCGLATTGPAAAEVWEALSGMMTQMGWTQAHDMPPYLPWLADVVVAAHPVATEDVYMMGDASRCMAWTIIERIWNR